MNMDLDAATKEAPTLTLDPFAEAKAEIVEKKPAQLMMAARSIFLNLYSRKPPIRRQSPWPASPNMAPKIRE